MSNINAQHTQHDTTPNEQHTHSSCAPHPMNVCVPDECVCCSFGIVSCRMCCSVLRHISYVLLILPHICVAHSSTHMCCSFFHTYVLLILPHVCVAHSSTRMCCSFFHTHVLLILPHPHMTPYRMSRRSMCCQRLFCKRAL